jgi:hypothetical protein
VLLIHITYTYIPDMPRFFQVFLQLMSTISQSSKSSLTYQHKPLLSNRLRQLRQDSSVTN